MNLPTRLGLACTAALLLAAGPSHAIGISDATGDLLGSYTGSTGGDLDVVGAFVTYNASNDSFVFSATMDADIGTTPGAFYVFGVNRGAGVAAFAANGVGGVVFDAVVRFNQNGSGAVNRTVGAGAGSTPLLAGSAQSFGSTIIGVISGSLLPSNGLAKQNYTWNLWPRATGPVGFAAISDFAPDNSNIALTNISAVPEPGTWLMLAGGLALLGLAARRRSQAGA